MCNFDCYIVHTLLMAKDALRAIFFRKSSWFYFYGWRVDVSPWIDIWRFSVSCIIGHLHFVIPSGEIFACFTNFCANFLCEEDTVFEKSMKRSHFSIFIIWISRKIQHQKLSITLKLIGTKNIFDVIFGVKIHMR